jgi:DNA replication and repair protein RecF
MYCSKLSLKDFRNYRKLELNLSSGLTIIQGENAAGKNTLLEAIYLLATTKSPRAHNEQELVSLEAVPEFGAPAFCRVNATIQRSDTDFLEAEIIVTRDDKKQNPLSEVINAARKRVKVNGVARRAAELIGQLNVVFFSPEDLDLVIGSPALRRRYLDITLSQVDRRYFRHLQEYTKLLAQRNGLLRNWRENTRNRTAKPIQRLQEELNIWDEELVKAGAYIILRRKICLLGLRERAVSLHANLVGFISQDYQPAFDLPYHPSFILEGLEDEVAVATRFRQELNDLREKELQRGVSLVGPHRDDFSFRLDGQDVAVFGSRGQQRTAVLALKLAEADWMFNQTGERPVLLLDDILSELDAHRRRFVLEVIQAGAEQTIVTTTDLALFGSTRQLAQHARLYRVSESKLIPLLDLA